MNLPYNSSIYRSVEGYHRACYLYEAFLKEVTVPFESGHVETSHGNTHVLIAGLDNHIPVVLFHGNSLFGPHMAYLINVVARDYRVIVPDVIGTMGRSDPHRPDRKSPAYGEWASSMLTALDIEAAHMVGISNGAWLIIKLATVSSQLISSAFLMSAGGFAPTNWRLGLALLPVMVLGPFMSRERHSRWFLHHTSPPGFAPSELSVLAMEVILRDYRREAIPTPFTDVQLGKLDAPTYLLMGEYERPFPPEKVIERASATLPNLQRAEILPGVAHGMISEDPQLVNERLLNWLSSVASR